MQCRHPVDETTSTLECFELIPRIRRLRRPHTIDFGQNLHESRRDFRTRRRALLDSGQIRARNFCLLADLARVQIMDDSIRLEQRKWSRFNAHFPGHHFYIIITVRNYAVLFFCVSSNFTQSRDVALCYHPLTIDAAKGMKGSARISTRLLLRMCIAIRTFLAPP